MSTMEEKGAEKVLGAMGKKTPFYMGPQMWPLGRKNTQPRQPGLGPALSRPGWAGTRSGRPWPGLSPAWAGQTAEKHPRKRTYFDHPNSVFDILGLVGIATKSSTRIYRETS